MLITRELAKTGTLEQFADEHGLELVIRERQMDSWQQAHGLKRYIADFRGAEVALGGGMLRGAYGEGDTEAAAIAAYARQISNESLVIDAWKPTRRELRVPRLEDVCGQCGRSRSAQERRGCIAGWHA